VINSDADPSLIDKNVVDAIRHHLSKRIILEVVDTHFLGLPTEVPLLTGILEIANQLLLLRVYRDRRFSSLQEPIRLGIDMLALCIAIRMICTLPRLAVGLKVIPCTV